VGTPRRPSRRHPAWVGEPGRRAIRRPGDTSEPRGTSEPGHPAELTLGGDRAPKSEALRALYWRSEILGVLYWLRGEQLGDLVDAPMIERFLGVDAATGITYLDRLVDDGYVVRDGDWYALSERGLQQGQEELATAFSDLLRPRHGACSDECWCQMSPGEAEACANQIRRRRDQGGRASS